MEVVERAAEITFAMAAKEWVLSLPPFRITALPLLRARAVIFAITSGRASNITKRTPMGEVSLYRSRFWSSFVARVILPTGVVKTCLC